MPELDGGSGQGLVASKADADISDKSMHNTITHSTHPKSLCSIYSLMQHGCNS